MGCCYSTQKKKKKAKDDIAEMNLLFSGMVDANQKSIAENREGMAGQREMINKV